jgi:hypothetical protein
MRKIAIPLTTTNYEYLQKKHPEELRSSYKDSLALSIEAIIKTHSYCKKEVFEKIDRKKYPNEVLLTYNENKWRRSGFSKISMEHVRLINRMIDVIMKEEFIEYSTELIDVTKEIEYKECIISYCEECGLSYDNTLFETLKKRFYRHRVKQK